MNIRRAASKAAELLMIGAVRAVFALARGLGPDRSADLAGWIARTIGPVTPHQTIARANIAAAFPDKPEAERAVILREAWDSLGRVGAEYAHLATIVDFDPERPQGAGRVDVDGIEHFIALRDDGKPGIIFSAHLANWELPAVIAQQFGLQVTAVFRPPNDPAIANVIHEIRSGTMGGLAASKRGAAFSMQAALEEGSHLGMLIDQHFTRGVVVPFMGREALANPVLAKFARRFDCPVHGVRVVRLPGRRFRIELTPPIALPRDAAGEIDVEAATAEMTAVIDGWVRENPGQWLWMHRRWRPHVIAEQKALREGAKASLHAADLNAT
jgi:Kdo2-lipid IVA lauroyltransferase/acyltransferase